MSLLDTIGSIAGNVLSGGVTGVLGVAVQRVADYKNKQLDLELNKQKLDNDLAMKEADYRIMTQEWAARSKIAETEAVQKTEASADQAFSASFNEPQRYSASATALTPGQAWLLVLLDFIRGIVRPGLTLYLSLVATLLYWQTRQLVPTVDPHEATQLMATIVDSLLYLTTTCVTWWFGTRNKGKAPSYA